MASVLYAHSAERLLAPPGASRDWDVVPAGGAAYTFAKRALDIAGAVLLLAALSPLMLVAAVLIKLTSRGPVLFRQSRVGLNGRTFVMLKFRSMRDGAETEQPKVLHLNGKKNGPIFKTPHDPRLTPIGRFLRRSSIDELPQLINCILGDMSLVGPRPLWTAELAKAPDAVGLRTLVKPGLTGLWQICGRSELPFDELVRLDMYYITHRSLLLDLLIAFQTVPAVLTARGAY